ncbi:hypothetical protein TeGR_g11069 [Tetraparma gracilis]|uniref:Uncharacterized protein n=1 Tax=Tetraparma gracilis TaxID=2962635 RepID=A0ABQ6MCB2_9STRA|nr:hypothetical protein TeGR_g11069 [Tetraparma gracilis]
MLPPRAAPLLLSFLSGLALASLFFLLPPPAAEPSPAEPGNKSSTAEKLPARAAGAGERAKAAESRRAKAAGRDKKAKKSKPPKQNQLEPAAAATAPAAGLHAPFVATLVWSKFLSCTLTNPSAAAKVLGSPGLLVYVSFAKDRSPGAEPLSSAAVAAKLSLLSSFLSSGRLHRDPATSRPCPLAESHATPSLLLVPMSSLTCRPKKNDVQYHDQLPAPLSGPLYRRLAALLGGALPGNVEFRAGEFGEKQMLRIDAGDGPQVHAHTFS